MGNQKRKRTDPRPDLRLTLDFVREEYRIGGIVLLSAYVGARKPNRLKCLFCSFEWIGTYDGFKRHGNRCTRCSNSVSRTGSQINLFDRVRKIPVELVEKVQKSHKLNIGDCIKLAEIREGLFLSGEYEGSQFTYRWQCVVGHIWETTHASVRKGSWCPLCSKMMGRRESECRGIMENLLGVGFPPVICNGEDGSPNIRNPKTGFPLRLDGFSFRMKTAFEYQGEHHYTDSKNPPPFATPDLVDSIRYKDNIKQAACKELGIDLVVIPYWVKDMRGHIFSCLGLA